MCDQPYRMPATGNELASLSGGAAGFKSKHSARARENATLRTTPTLSFSASSAASWHNRHPDMQLFQPSCL